MEKASQEVLWLPPSPKLSFHPQPTLSLLINKLTAFGSLLKVEGRAKDGDGGLPQMLGSQRRLSTT